MIRNFLANDEPACREIIRACFEQSVTLEEKASTHIKNRFTEPGYLQSKKYPISVFERDGSVLGMGALDGNEIKKCYVHPREQGKGIGKELLKDLEALALKKGKSGLFLHAYANSKGFYQKEGWKIIGLHILELDGIQTPVIEMRKKVM